MLNHISLKLVCRINKYAEHLFRKWRQYNWVGVQHFHETESSANFLTQCVPRSKCDTIFLFKIKFVLRDLLDSVRFIVVLWKFLHLEIDTPAPFLPCFMVIESVVTKPWLVNSDRPWRLNGKYGRCSTMACSRDFGGGYKSCSHWSNFFYPRKDSTRYLRRVGPIRRTLRASKRPFKHLHPACVQRRHAYGDASVMVLWYLARNCKLPLVGIHGKHERLAEFRRGHRHSGCATPWQPPVAGPAMYMHAGAMPATRCEYQGPAAVRSHGIFGLAKQKFWFECDRKLVVLHQTILKQCQHYRP